MNKFHFLGALLALGGVSSAANADSLVPPSNFNWNGAYIGGHFGWAGSHETLHDLDGYNDSGGFGDFSNSIDNAFGGAQAGYNFVSGGFVYGLEGEIGYLSLESSKQFPPYVGVRGPDDSRDSTSGGIYGTIAGRLGFAFDRVLVYGKAGWGFADVDASFIDTDPIGTVLVSGTKTSDTLSGAVFGGGIELAMTDSISIKVEYLRMNFGDTLTHTADNQFGEPFRFSHVIDDIDTVKVGFNIKLGREPQAVEPLK